MAINLEKGQRIDIGLKKAAVGLGWDPASGSGDDFDLDASAFCLGENRKTPTDQHFVFYNNKFSPDKAVEGADDDTTGGNSDGGDDETININLAMVEKQVNEIIVIASIHDFENRKQNFGQVRNSYIRIYDAETNEEICKYELDEDFSIETAVEFGRLYRKEGKWKFEAIGVGYKKGLEELVSKYTS